MNADGNALNQLGDVTKQTARDTTSKQSLKNMAVAGITAGIVQGIGVGIEHLSQASAAADGVNTVNSGANVVNASGGVSNPSAFPTTLDTSFTNVSLKNSLLRYYGPVEQASLKTTFLTNLQNSAVQTISSSVAQSAVNGDSLEESLKNASMNMLINAVGETIGSEIALSAKAEDINGITHLSAIAAVGCGMGIAGGNNCAAGAVSGLAGAFVGDAVHNNPDLSKGQASAIAKMAGAAASAAIAGPDDGGSVFAGSNIAQSTQNIYNEIGLVLTPEEKVEVDYAIINGDTEKVFAILGERNIKVTDATKEKIRRRVESEIGGNEFLASLTTAEKWELVQPKPIGVFFDGTGNDAAVDIAKGSETNVARLFDIYANDTKIYIKGIGTGGGLDYLCQAFGCGASSKEREAGVRFYDLYKEDKQPFVITDLVGFSRGAATARNFGNNILENGINTDNGSIPSELIVLRSETLFDTVSSFGLPNNIDLGKDFTTSSDTYVIHAVAEDERRSNFSLQSIEAPYMSPNWIEKRFPGVHSDIGGSIADGSQGKGNDMAFYTLNWAVDNANKMTGENIFNIPSESQQPSAYLNALMNLYNEAKTSKDQTNVMAAKSIFEDKFVHDNVIWYNPAHWSFGDRDIYHPNAQ